MLALLCLLAPFAAQSPPAEEPLGNVRVTVSLRWDATDGIRIHFDNGDVAHVRPSGNAPQLRIYAVAGTQERANEIVRLALSEPDGILRNLERASVLD